MLVTRRSIEPARFTYAAGLSAMRINRDARFTLNRPRRQKAKVTSARVRPITNASNHKVCVALRHARRYYTLVRLIALGVCNYQLLRDIFRALSQVWRLVRQTMRIGEQRRLPLPSLPRNEVWTKRAIERAIVAN